MQLVTSVTFMPMDNLVSFSYRQEIIFLKGVVKMKPLSALKYSINNKKKLITSIISILVAVTFLYCFQTFIKCEYNSMRELYLLPFKTRMMLYSSENNKPIPENIVNTLNTDSNIEKAIPFVYYQTRYAIPGSLSISPILGIRAEDMEYVIKKHNGTIKEGRLPKEGCKEVALDSRLALNKKVKLGDKIGNSAGKNIKNEPLDGEYTIIGIIESPDYLSIMPFSTASVPNATINQALIKKSLLIFPKENKTKEVDNLLLSFPRNQVRATTLSEITKDFNGNSSVLKTLDMLCILSILVMVVSVGSSKYVQFFSRKQEFGVLNAIGYTKTKIMKKAFQEVVLVNLIGYILGIGFGVLASFFVNNASFNAVGAVAVYFYSRAFIVALFVPLFTTLFTLVPVNRMINKLDPIIMIEGI